MSQLPPPMLNDGALRTEKRRSAILLQAAPHFLHHIALDVVALKGRPGMAVQISFQSGQRKDALFMRRDADIHAALIHAAQEAAARVEASTSRTPGMARMSFSIDLHHLVHAPPGSCLRGALTLTSNSASSTLVGMYSCLTS